MSTIFKMEVENNFEFQKLNIGFGDPSTNPEMVSFVEENAPSISGKPLLINGPASLPIGMTLAHKYAHVVPFITVFDPKLSQYVVSISHDPVYPIGTTVTEESLKG